MGITNFDVVEAGIKHPVEVMAADGAISLTAGVVVITKSTAAALTLAAPALDDDGKVLRVVDAAGAAHTVDGAINGGSDPATFGGAAGDALTLVAYDGVWYSAGLLNVTIGGGGD